MLDFGISSGKFDALNLPSLICKLAVGHFKFVQ